MLALRGRKRAGHRPKTSFIRSPVTTTNRTRPSSGPPVAGAFGRRRAAGPWSSPERASGFRGSASGSFVPSRVTGLLGNGWTKKDRSRSRLREKSWPRRGGRRTRSYHFYYRCCDFPFRTVSRRRRSSGNPRLTAPNPEENFVGISLGPFQRETRNNWRRCCPWPLIFNLRTESKPSFLENDPVHSYYFILLKLFHDTRSIYYIPSETRSFSSNL